MTCPKTAAALLACLTLCACAQRSLPTDRERLVAAMRSHPVALLGEVHDNAAQHALRAEALQVFLESGARPALLMEQFDRERQPDLDRALAKPGVTADEVIAAATPADPAGTGRSTDRTSGSRSATGCR
jgi:Haem-binding uptake, Tiki superfamily, ChaN